jgi:hypothetical protein
MEAMSEKLILAGKSPSQASNELFRLPTRKHAGKVLRLKSFPWLKGSAFYPTQPLAQHSTDDSDYNDDKHEDSIMEWRTL